MERADSHEPGAGCWGNVDHDARTYLQYLDAAHSHPGVREYKTRTFQALDVRPGHQVLDVGCGTGEDVRALATLVGPTGGVTGLDSSAAMITEAQQRPGPFGVPLHFVVGDAHALDFADGTFDEVRTDRTLQLLKDPAQAVAEMLRVLRRGGRLVAVEPDWDTLVVDSTDLATTRAIVAFRCDRMPQGRIGRQLRRRLIGAGAIHVEVTGLVLTVSEYAAADYFCALHKSAVDAAEAGVVDSAAAAQWVESLRETDRAGRFFAAVTILMAVGQKP